MEQKFYICKHCGNIIAKVKDTGARKSIRCHSRIVAGSATNNPTAPINAVLVFKSYPSNANKGIDTRASPKPNTVRTNAPNHAISKTPRMIKIASSFSFLLSYHFIW